MNYANGMSFEISNDYMLIGKAPYVRSVHTYDDQRPGTGTSVVHVFAKAGAQYKDKTEFIIVYDFQLPSRWSMRKPGMVPSNIFGLELSKYPAVADLLKEKGIVTATKFLCGEFFLYTYTSGQQSVSYCASESVVPAGVDHRTFLNGKFSESVQIVSSSEIQTAQQVFAPVQKSPVLTGAVASSSVEVAQGRGKHVAIAYSKVGNAIFMGRSCKSGSDALDMAVTGCQHSDCRGVWISTVDGCVAFAKHSSGAWGKARGVDLNEATAKALKFCNAHTKNDDCEVLATLCSEY